MISTSRSFNIARSTRNFKTHLLREISTKVEKSVLISESNDIYTNLALEDWLYRHGGFRNGHLLMLWSNDPCVVIGKFQNPWLEADVSGLGVMTPNGIKLARRNSGGGTVYHDRGNLNLTFFTPREHYKRRLNLETIGRAIFKEYGIKIDISPREDLVLNDCKVSGTASKLGRLVAYHHCTLLVKANRTYLSSSLKKPRFDIKTNATQSVKSEILNLCDVDDKITVENLMVSIGEEYLQTVHNYVDPKLQRSEKERARDHKYGETEYTPIGAQDKITKFRILNPTERDFPGLTELRDTLASWDWIYGKCPKFTATKCYPAETLKGQAVESSNGQGRAQLSISVAVEQGKIKDVSLTPAAHVDGAAADLIGEALNEFKDRKFSERIFGEVNECVSGVRNNDCVRVIAQENT